MSGRLLTNLAGFQNRTLTGLSSINTAETDISNIKEKYDYGATVAQGNLLIGNSVGNYSSTSISALTETTTINDDDLFLISNSTGTDVKNITGTNLATQVLVDLGTANGLSKTGNTISIANNAVVETQTFTLNNQTGNLDLNLNTGNSTSYQARLYFKNGGVEKARFVYDSANNKLDCLTKTGQIHFKAFQGTNDGTSRLLLDNGTFQLQAGSASVSLTDIIKGSLTSVNIYKETNFQGNDIVGVDLINGYDPSLPTLNSTTDQVLVKTTVAGAFSSGDLLTVDSNNLLANITRNTLQGEFFNNIIAGNNLNKTTSNNQLYINLDSDLNFVSSINGFYVNSELLNNSSPQIIVKDNSVSFTNGDILAIANNKLSKTTPTDILGNLTAGSNLTKTGNTIDLDSTLTSITSINGYTANVLTLNNSNQQFLVKDTTVNYSSGDILAINSSNKLSSLTKNDILADITVSNGLSKVGNNIQIATNPTIETPTFTIKNSTDHCELNIESGNSTSKESRIFFRNSGTERARILYSSDNNKLDCLTLAGAIHLKAYKDTNNEGTSRLLLDNGSFQLQCGSASVSLTDIIKGTLTAVDIYKATDFNNNDITNVNTLNGYSISADIGGITAGTNLNKSGTTINLNASLTGITNINSTTISQKVTVSANTTTLGGVVEILKGTTTSYDVHSWEILNDAPNANNRWLIFRALASGSLSAYDFVRIGLTDTNSAEPATKMVDIRCRLAMNNNAIRLGDPNSTTYYIKRDSTSNGIELVGNTTNDNYAVVSIKNSSSSNITQFYHNRVDIYKPIDMNNNKITFKANDTFQYVEYNGTGMDGIDIVGFGNTSLACCRIRSGNGGVDLLKAFTNRINIYKPLYTNFQEIYFQGDNNQNHYIKYAGGTGIDGVEIAGYGGSASEINRPVFRVKSTRTGNINLDCFPQDPANTNPNQGRTTHIYNKLSVLKGGATGQDDTNDIFTVKNTGFCKAIIHSDNGDVELALKCGSSNADQAVIKRIASIDRFLINNVGEIRTEATSHNFYNSTTLRLAWQSDTNLVVYDGSTVKFASNDSQNAHSSRDYKKNINDLVESESIDIIKNLNPVSFEYLEKYWSEHDSCNACGCNLRKGFIWEDTKPVLPQATRTINMNNPDEETTKTLDLKMVIPDLTKTVQYLLNKVESLESTLSTQESTISNLNQQLITQATLISNLQSQIDSN